LTEHPQVVPHRVLDKGVTSKELHYFEYFGWRDLDGDDAEVYR
jgi:hypothetical protein